MQIFFCCFARKKKSEHQADLLGNGGLIRVVWIDPPCQSFGGSGNRSHAHAGRIFLPDRRDVQHRTIKDGRSVAVHFASFGL